MIIFYFSYDLVDHIILSNPSPKIKGIKFNLEKTPTSRNVFINIIIVYDIYILFSS